MADILEFFKAPLPPKRFSQELIDELYKEVPLLIEEDREGLIIEHLYIQPRDAFMRHHADPVDAGPWLGMQEQIRMGAMQEFFPYPDSRHICNGLDRGQTV